MSELVIGVLLGFLVAAGIVAGGYALFRKGRLGRREPEVRVFASLEELRSIGLLSVFKVVTKEIVTAKEHWAGVFGKKYLGWLMSAKKMAMIFEFDIDFRFDLRDPEFQILEPECAAFRIQMPRCTYEIHIRDINFYDEQKARLLPWLLPDLVTAVFGAGFDEEDRNKLKEEAKQQAFSLAKDLVVRLRGEVQNSARETMITLARGFSAQKVLVEFKDQEPEKTKVDFAANAEAA